MAQSTVDPVSRQQQVSRWIARVEELISQVKHWSENAGWSVERKTKTLRDESCGQYDVPQILVTLPTGELNVEPFAIGSNAEQGRVDFEAFPTLSRVKLIGGEGWTILTDSNVPLRVPWDERTFVQLAHDLLS